jgi:cephalosporin hydroxylase
MNIQINNKSFQIFSGAKVIDAVRMYFTEIGENFEIDDIVVEDKFGNKLEFDGRLRNNKSLFIKF